MLAFCVPCDDKSDEKGDTTRSLRGYISPTCREFPTQTNSTEIGLLSRGLRHNQSHQGGEKYRVTELQICLAL